MSRGFTERRVFRNSMMSDIYSDCVTWSENSNGKPPMAAALLKLQSM
jgi:hypothetical protein